MPIPPRFDDEPPPLLLSVPAPEAALADVLVALAFTHGDIPLVLSLAKRTYDCLRVFRGALSVPPHQFRRGCWAHMRNLRGRLDVHVLLA